MAVFGFSEEELLQAGLAVLLAELLEGEGGLADTGLGSFVTDLVDVGLDGRDLLLDLCNNFFHDVQILV